MIQLYSSKGRITELFGELLSEMKGFKYQITLFVTLKKSKLDGTVEYATVYLNSFVKTVINYDFDDSIDKSFSETLFRLDNWINEGSGWVIEKVNDQYLNISQYAPLVGSSFIEFPKELKNSKKGLINLRNIDNKCFIWCHVRYLNPVSDNASRIKRIDKKIARTLDYGRVEFPVKAKDVGVIEDKNEICTPVFSYEDKIVCPVYVSKKKYGDCMNLLMIHEGNKSHYVYVKDFNRLMFNINKHGEKKRFCMRCLQHFSSEIILEKHKDDCLVVDGEQRVKLDSGYVEFKNYANKLRVPFKIYADFECILKKFDGVRGSCDSSRSVKESEHVPCGFGYNVVCVDDTFSKDVVVYRGKDCVSKFISCILDEYECCRRICKDYFNKSLIMSAEEEEMFQNACSCWICGRLFDSMDEKVRDHCHISGKFRGAAHFSCDVNFKISKKVPVVFHNLKGYDGHLIMKELSNFDVSIDVIPCGLEKYIAFIVNRWFVFIDSMQFMNSSLDALVGNLGSNDFKCLSKVFGDDEQFELVKCKGVYPYEWVDGFDKFDWSCLPSKECFFSSLKGKGIGDKGYDRTCKVWNAFGMKIFGEYHDLYLKCDVLLLCAVFETFIDSCFRLDPCHYFSSPGLAWDPMLKMSGVRLRLIDDVDTHLFIEKGVRGGICYIAKRYCRANNKFVKGYDSSLEKSCGAAMLEYLPYDEFEWLSDDEIDSIDFNGVSAESDVGYILEVDLKYSSKLHELNNDYPLAPEKMRVSKDMLSEYCLGIAEKYDVKVGDVVKLIPNLGDKSCYVLHYRALQLYVSLGMVVKRIHRVLKFKQSDWLKSFVMFNTAKRMNAANEFEKSFFKLIINSVFGKTMENVRKRINVKLINNEKKYLKAVSRPSFVSQKILDKNLVAVHKIKPVLLLNKPIYVGFSILELSKMIMYDWHYNYFVKKFDCSLLFTDTDSLVYEIKGNDSVYDEVFRDKELFDFSGYDRGSTYYDCANKKVIGKMKDEMSGKIIAEFVGLRSKIYSIVTVDDEKLVRAKGVNKALMHSEFKDVLFDKKVVRHCMKRILAKGNKIGTYDVCKISLLCFDDKRFALIGVNSLAYGHARIND